MESEPARVPGLAANECALRCGIRVLRSPLMGDEITVFHHGEATRLATGSAPKAAELRPCEFDSRPLRSWKRKQTGDCTRLEPGRASALSVRLAPLPLATTQLVEGACLIRR